MHDDKSLTAIQVLESAEAYHRESAQRLREEAQKLQGQVAGLESRAQLHTENAAQMQAGLRELRKT